VRQGSSLLELRSTFVGFGQAQGDYDVGSEVERGLRAHGRLI
jgi:hypothetical protein